MKNKHKLIVSMLCILSIMMIQVAPVYAKVGDSWGSTVHYAKQKDNLLDISLNMGNYNSNYREATRIETVIVAAEGGGEEKQGQDETVENLITSGTPEGYTAYSDAIYKYNNTTKKYEIAYRSGEQVHSPESSSDAEDLYVFYTNDAIWDATNGELRKNNVTVNTGDHIRNEKTTITLNGEPFTNGRKAQVGDQIVVNSEPDEGYFIHWTIEEVDNPSVLGAHIASAPQDGTGNTFAFKMGTKEIKVTPIAEQLSEYEITYEGLEGVGLGGVNATFNGSKENPNPVQCHDYHEYALTAPQATGKKFIGWQVNDTKHTVIKDGILKDVNANRKLTALWEDTEYTLSANYIYEDELRSDYPIDDSVIKVTLNRNNDKKPIILKSGQYVLDKDYTEFGEQNYVISVIADTISQIENKENKTEPEETYEEPVPDKTIKGKTTISMNATIKSIVNGEKFTYEPLAKQSGEKKVKIVVSNKKVASASKKGVIKGKKTKGMATIKRTVNKQTVSGSEIKIYNQNPKFKKKIKLSGEGAEMSIAPEGYEGPVNYEIEDTSVVTVDKNGLVTGKTYQGSTKITATIHNKRYKIKVQVGETM